MFSIQVSEFAQFGPGVTNYFKFLKWCFWMFVVMFMLYMTPMIANTFGQYYFVTNSVVDLALTTVGNLGGFDVNGNTSSIVVTLPDCQSSLVAHSCGISSQDLAKWYCTVTIMATIFFIAGYFWLRIFEAREVTVLDENTVSAEDFTIRVYRLPPKITELQIRAHFAEVTGETVAEVTIAYDNEKEIKLYRRRGEIVKQRYRASQELRYFIARKKSDGDKSITNEFLKNITKQRVDLTHQINDLDVEIMKFEDDKKGNQTTPLCAYVTFETVMGAQKALREYNISWLDYSKMSAKLRLKGRRLIVTKAPEPSTIIWENLKYTTQERFLKRLTTGFYSILLLIFSAMAAYGPRLAGSIASDSVGSNTCPTNFKSWSTEEKKNYVETYPVELHCYCDRKTAMQQSNDPLCHKYFIRNLQNVAIIITATVIILTINVLIDFLITRLAAKEKHHSVNSREQSVFIRMFIAKFINTGLLFLFGNYFSFFGDIIDVKFPSHGTFSPLWYSTVGVNVILVQLGNVFAIHALRTIRYRYFIWEQERIAREYKDDDAKLLSKSKGAVVSEKQPSSPSWWSRIGCASDSKVNITFTQDDLNYKFLGPDFLIARRYAQVLTDLFVCLLFASGMPVLLLFGMVNFYVSYWIDKFFFVRYYRTPPRYSAYLARYATYLLPFAIAFHLAVAIWVYGASAAFVSTELASGLQNKVSVYDQLGINNILSQKYIIPLVYLFCIVLLGICLRFLWDRFYNGINTVLRGLFGSYFSQNKYIEELNRYVNATIQVTYSRAVRRGIIKGLKNYNMLENPVYREAFAISDKFSMAHKQLSAIRKHADFSSFGEDKISSFDKSIEQISPSSGKLTSYFFSEFKRKLWRRYD